MIEKLSVSILGAGKVGSQLAKRCHQQGIKVYQIYNRDGLKAKRLAKSVGAQWVNDISAIDAISPHVIFIAVKDSAISDVALSLKYQNPKCLVVHLSGTYTMESLAALLPRVGGFYPLMTFNQLSTAPWKTVPIGIQATEKSDLLILENIANQIGGSWFHLSDDQRTGLHVAAVFANNFTNYLIGSAFQLVKTAQLDPSILHPLIQETVKQALIHVPEEVQTGPAIRNDEPTILKHLALLSDYPDYQKLYQLFTQLIQSK